MFWYISIIRVRKEKRKGTRNCSAGEWNNLWSVFSVHSALLKMTWEFLVRIENEYMD